MRQEFKCERCGLVIAGRVGVDGRIYSWDKSSTKPAGVKVPCICTPCQAETHIADRLIRVEGER